MSVLPGNGMCSLTPTTITFAPFRPRPHPASPHSLIVEAYCRGRLRCLCSGLPVVRARPLRRPHMIRLGTRGTPPLLGTPCRSRLTSLLSVPDPPAASAEAAETARRCSNRGARDRRVCSGLHLRRGGERPREESSRGGERERVQGVGWQSDSVDGRVKKRGKSDLFYTDW